MGNTFKGTPGPWSVNNYANVDNDLGYTVAGVFDGANAPRRYADMRIVIANARLIAAAPELLEALQEIIRQHDLDTESTLLSPIPNRWMEAISKAEKAINKALGR